MPRLRRVLFVYWTLRAQSDHSGGAAIRLGVAQLPAAAALEKDQRDSLPQLARAGADVGRSVCSSCRADARVYRDSEHAGGHNPRAHPRRVSHPSHGNPLRI